MDIKNFLLEETCRACPEQYDIYFNGKYVGWFKLRHGIFRLMDLKNNEICYLVVNIEEYWSINSGYFELDLAYAPNVFGVSHIDFLTSL
jgi:hypothetical protein